MTLTQEEIRNAYRQVLQAEDALEELIMKLREACNHQSSEVKHRSNTGNYDPTADSYWSEYKCNDCGKRWVVEH